MNTLLKDNSPEVKTLKDVMREAIEQLGDFIPKKAFNSIFDEAATFDDIQICEDHDREFNPADGCEECCQEAEAQCKSDERCYWEAKGAL